MIYNNYLNEYVNTNDEDCKKKQLILNNFITTYNDDELLRANDLLEFIEDFIHSNEYQKYIEEKQNIVKIDKSVQCYVHNENILKQQIIVTKKYPLTFKARKLYALARELENYVKNEQNTKIVKAQEKGIEIIRNKIDQVKKLFLSQKYDINNKTLEELNLLDFCQRHDIDILKLDLVNKSKIYNKILYYKKFVQSRKHRQNSNIINIYKKLLNERKRQKQIEDSINKTYTYQVRKLKTIQEAFDDEKINIEFKSSEVEESEISVEEDEVIEEPEKISIALPKKNSNRLTKKSKKDVASKRSKPIKSKTSKNKEKTKRAPEEILNVVDNFDQLEEVLENKSISIKSLEDNLDYAIDNYFLIHPEIVIFNNFTISHTYKQYIRITNVSKVLRKFKFCNIISSVKNLSPDLCQVCPLTIQKLAPGCSSNIKITFKSNSLDPIEGKLVFLSYDAKTCLYYKFIVRFKCIPEYAQMVIEPLQINFGQIPVWTSSPIFKEIKIKNVGIEPCFVIFKNNNDTSSTSTNTSNTSLLFYDDKAESLSFIKAQVKSQSVSKNYNKFKLEKNCLDVDGMSEITVKIFFMNIKTVGFYYETGVIEIYKYSPEEQGDVCIIDTREYCLQVEVIKHFLQLRPETLFFGVCIFNRNYKLSVDVFNNSKQLQVISVKYPSSMVDFISTRTSTMFIPPGTFHTIWLKFCPTEYIIRNKFQYYDPNTFIIEFPIYFCIVTRPLLKIPHVKLITYAILNNCYNFVFREILPPGEPIQTVDLGRCSVQECIWTQIYLQNLTFSPQVFLFTNVPKCLTIMPNYGCGEILPEEKFVLTLYFQPQIQDYFNTNETGEFSMKLQLETIFGFNSSKNRKFEFTSDRNSIKVLFKELKRTPDKDLENNIMNCVAAVKNNFKNFNNNMITSSISYSDTESVSTLEKSFIFIKAKIVPSIYEFSYQQVEFPKTPCGSYSFMEIHLQPSKLSNIRRKYLHGEAKYSLIAKGNKDIQIAPTCGNLILGQRVRLVLTATPSVPAETVYERAKNLKYLEVYQKKRDDIEEMKFKESEHVKSKSKKGKQEIEKGRKKPKVSKKAEKSEKSKDIEFEELNVPQIKITEKGINIDYKELFNAEMQFLKYFEQLTIETQFICKMEYNTIDLEPEQFYLNTICKVIRPSFITNLISQRLDFGLVAIGMVVKRIITIQNIKSSLKLHKILFNLKTKVNITDDTICLELDEMNPIGPFRMFYLKDLSIQPENNLEIPIRFAPFKEGQVEEFFELRSKCGTKLRLTLSGEGIQPIINVSPNFLVLRINGTEGDLTRCAIEFTNKSSCHVLLTFEKVCELEGLIEDLKDVQDEKLNTNKKKLNSKMKSNETKSKTNKKTTEKNSNELTSNEQYCIEHGVKVQSTCYFDFINPDDKCIELLPNSKKSVSIYFGKNELLEKHKEVIKQQKLKAAEEQIKAKGKKGSKNSSEKASKYSNKSSKKEKKTHSIDSNKRFIVKYNIFLGKSFFRDIIIVANFT